VTEVTVNLFTLWTMQAHVGRPLVDGFARWKKEAPAATAAILDRFSGGGISYAAWCKDPVLALHAFASLAHRFGWVMVRDTMAALLAEVGSGAAAPRSTGADGAPEHLPLPPAQQRVLDGWVTAASRVSGRNLGPYFVSWGLQASSAALRAVQGLPSP
jgi:hypothetical protein